MKTEHDALGKYPFRENFSYSLDHKSVQKLSGFLRKKLRKQSEESWDFFSKQDPKTELLNFVEKTLKSKKIFSSHTNIQILLHLKGSIRFFLIQRGHRKKDDIELKDVSFFNDLFRFVNRSKNKNFSLYDDPKAKVLNSLGSFLADGIELGATRIILVAARNEFLPSTANEREEFQSLWKERRGRLSYLVEKFRLTEERKSVLALNSIFPHLSHSGPRSFTSEVANLVDDETYMDVSHAQRIKILGELLNTLNHEISNPLFGVKLATDLLKESESTDPDQKEFFNLISGNVERCQGIIESFSFLFNESIERKKVTLKRIIDNVLIMSKSEIKFFKKSIDIDPNIEVFTNEIWLVQIIFNIIINASHAINESKARGHIQIRALKKNDKSISIEIEDNGPGVPASLQERIFGPYFSTKKQGHGLGLALCRRLIQKLGGTIELQQSAPGKTVFYLEHPTEVE